MQRGFAAGFVGALFAGPALAADIPLKAAAKAERPAAPVFGWTGCYVGGHVGGGGGFRDVTDPSGFRLPPSAFPFKDDTPFGVNSLAENVPASGLLTGAQVGCKYQFAHNWVVGVEGEYSGAQLSGDRQLALTPDPFVPSAVLPANLHVQTDWLASTAATLGYSFNGLLLYVKGGAAWTKNKYEMTFGSPDLIGVLPQGDFLAWEKRIGWTAGAGFEYPFANQFSAKLEYDYYDFGAKAVPFVELSPASLGSIEVKQRVHAIKLGLNYYFWNVSPAAVVGPAAAPAMSWSETFSSEVRYFSWQGTRGTPTNAVAAGGTPMPLATRGSGAELYTPYAAQLVGQSNDFKIEMLMRGGWVRANQTTMGLSGSVSTATDTVTSGTITYLGLSGLQPFASLDLNLPTGLAALTATQVNARMDPDLVDISTFGEGLNIGPTVGINVPLSEAWLLTLSAGYTHRGPFTTEGPITPAAGGAAPQSTNIKPGEAITLTGVLGYQAGPLSGKLTGTITDNGTTREGEQPFVRPGRRYLIAGTTSYDWPGDHSGTTTLNASAAHSERNQVLFQCLTGCPTTLVTEPFNANSNVYQVGVQHLFNLNGVGVGPTGSFLFRDNNGYEPTTLQFVPAKQRWAVGALAQYAPTNALNFTARIDRIWTRENDTPGLPGGEMFSVLAGSTVTAFEVPVISSNGWLFAVGMTANF
jgi:opacity protein-like surface antigen